MVSKAVLSCYVHNSVLTTLEVTKDVEGTGSF